MLLVGLIFLLLVTAVSLRREFTILFNRVAIIILLYSGIIGHGSLFVSCLETGIGVYNGLFHSTAITHSLDLFLYTIVPIIILLTAFYPRRIVTPKASLPTLEGAQKGASIYIQNSVRQDYMDNNPITIYSQANTKGQIAYLYEVMGREDPKFGILEYPLITLFILKGAILLMSSSDLISMFLAIELQSYGLYILSTLYRNSERSTSAGLTYFLLGAKRIRTSLVLCLQLSNSGDALKLLIPSYSRKIISGPTNHWCKVTSQKISEKIMGYRGSKSVIFNNIAVKEQRVDGSG